MASAHSISKILNKEISCEFIHEDEQCVVFDELNPQAVVHFVVVPKKNLPTLSNAKEEDERLLVHLMLVAKNIALEKRLERSGYHVRVDEHYDEKNPRFICLHVFGRALQHMLWPVGSGCRL